MKQFYAFILAVLGLSAAATNHQVQVGSNYFSPASLSIHPGDTVTWTQVSGTHNVNGSASVFAGNPVSFGNGATAGGTWTYSFVFTTPGLYQYQCDPHASMGMVGSINVVTLSPGAIAFTGITADAPDTYQFVAMNAIPGGSVIKFTDISWGPSNWYNAGLTTGEQDTVVYTAPALGLAPGSVVTLADDGNGGTLVTGGGTAVGVLGGISASGDHVFAFQGSKNAPAFIAAVGNSPFISSGNVLSTSSYLPTGLTLGVNAMSIASAHIDNGFYQCDSAVTTGTEADIRAAIYDPTNWNTNNSLISVSNWPSCTYSIGVQSTACADLFFSEYIEGSGNNKGLEIYNPTANAINLSGYTVIEKFSATTPAATFALSGTIPAHGTHVIVANQADPAMLAIADTALAFPSVVHFNGNDAVGLLNSNGDTLDVIGDFAYAAGSNFTVGTGSMANYTLVRKDSVNAGTSDWSLGQTQWMVHPINTFSF
jgi:plastocyanin